MNHKTKYRVRVLRKAGFVLYARRREVNIPHSTVPENGHDYQGKIKRALDYLSDKGWNLQTTIE